MSTDKPWSMFDEPTAEGAAPLPALLHTRAPRPTEPPKVARGMGVFRWTLTIRATMFADAAAFERALAPGFTGVDKGHKHFPLWTETYDPIPRRLGTRIVFWSRSKTNMGDFTCRFFVLQSGEQVAALPDITEHMHGVIEHEYGTITCQRRTEEQYVEAFSASSR